MLPLPDHAAQSLVGAGLPTTVASAVSGMDALFLSTLADRAFAGGKNLAAHIVRDDSRLAMLEGAIRFFNPGLRIVTLPAWDCLPYDRVGPNTTLSARRMTTLNALARGIHRPTLLLTTINAALQRVPSRSYAQESMLSLKLGATADRDQLIKFLIANTYARASQVTDPGEFAVRGGLLDVFASGADAPVRIDFFGDEIDSLRRFDPIDQRTTSTLDKVTFQAAGEVAFDEDARQAFRRNYVNTFGPNKDGDPLYDSVVDGRPYQGMEHWLPFFHDGLETIFDYVEGGVLTLDHQLDAVADQRLTAIDDYYDARKTQYDARRKQKSGESDLMAAPLYKPVVPISLYLNKDQWLKAKGRCQAHDFSPFDTPEAVSTLSLDARQGRDFGPERGDKSQNVYDAVADHIKALQKDEKRIIFACNSAGSAERLAGVLEDHKVPRVGLAPDWQAIRQESSKAIAVCELPLDTGFETKDLAIITEQDVLGDRLARRSRKNRRAEDFLKDASGLTPGDLVVHASHGIGRFEGLETVDVMNAKHDCVLLTYYGGDKLYVPVENIEILSRHGSDADGTQLDKLGGVAWQARKARMKERIREMAEGLIKLAAERELKEGTVIDMPSGLYDEFCARFPYVETDDQLRAIADVTQDLAKGRPMDRLVCGDVGFGKTEVALRAAFLAVMAGMQVAVIAPTTLLARQHYLTFIERFKGLPVHIGQLSRLVTSKTVAANKKEMADGKLDIVIGTHALLAKDVSFDRLGLMIVDEEQHFGVAHKERLKSLRANVHILTLTATPIPRTLQMAMSGIRDLSIIASPPVDRLAVRTFVLPFDPVVAREALLREHYRGGQSFFVVPHIADLDDAARFLKEDVPEVKSIIGHGQMTPSTLEDVMTAFYEGRYDVLLSTTIVESGIDIPRANTLIVHRSDQFGLAQLYQLRGRVGRSKTRAYAYLTTPPGKLLTENATRRLQVLQTLDNLGAGFSIASHDMDIRGAGNLLGDEQSGHVKEVGVELYQKMLEEAVAAARAGLDDDGYEADWSPQINVGATVMIPDHYVPDLSQRLALYRRLADLETREAVDDFCAEMIDRFGPLPNEVKQLAAVTIIKGHAKRAGIEKLDAGPKGMTLSFRDQKFANPVGLVDFISSSKRPAKVRPDHSLVIKAVTDKLGVRLNVVASTVKNLAAIAAQQP